MNHTTINSFGVFKNLKEAGIPEAQAEAIAMTFYELDVSLMKKMSDMLDAKFASQETLLDAKFASLPTKTDLYIGLVGMFALVLAVLYFTVPFIST